MRCRSLVTLAAATAVAGLAGCGSDGAAKGGERASRDAAATPTPTASPAAEGRRADWTRFDYDAARSGVAPHGIAPGDIGPLRGRRISLPGTVDSSPILLGGVRVRGSRHDLLVMTTTYGVTVGLDARTGRQLWRFTPRAYRRVAGTPQITTATPVADPDRRHVYASSPDGRIHKLRTSDGRQIRRGAWPVSVTRNANHEKIASALNLDGRWVLVTTGGYIGDQPPYQGKVAAIDRRSGRIVHVINSLCENRRRVIDPGSCPAQESAIWGRAGAVVSPANHHLFAASSNGPFNGRTNWGDSVLELAPGARRLLRHYTPTDQARLEALDIDLGSTSPALLPAPHGGSRPRFLLQGGKDAKLRLLALPGSLHGVRGAAGRRLGGERQIVPVVGGQGVFTAPAVLHRAGRTTAFVATGGGTAAYRLRGGRLHRIWSNGTAGTSPVIAGRVLWVYDPNGALNAYRPNTGRLIHRFAAPPGHWNSPIVAGGRVYLPTGNSNEHRTSGSLSLFAPR